MGLSAQGNKCAMKGWKLRASEAAYDNARGVPQALRYLRANL
jgi:hypothetical protein